MPAKGGTGIASPAGLSGDITTTVPLPVGAGEERRRRGRGGGERRAVHDEIPAECMFGTGTPGLRPLRALTTKTPAPAREPYGRASMVLFAGEGVPSPSPSPGRPFRGYHDYCAPPRGGGERRAVYGEMPVRDRIRAGTPGSHHENPLHQTCTKPAPKTPSDHNIRVSLHVFAADRRRVVAGGERECKADALIHDLRLHIG